jgi:hypothetical protein
VPGKLDFDEGAVRAHKRAAIAQLAGRAAKDGADGPRENVRALRPADALALVLDLEDQLRTGAISRDAYDTALTALRERQSR